MRITLLGILALFAALSLPCAGCPSEDPTDNDSADDDATSDDDDATADDDDDAGDDDDDTFMPDDVDGEVLVELNEFNNGGGGMVSTGRFYAQLYDILTPSTGGVAYNVPTNMDECAVTLYTLEDINTEVPAEIEYQSGGTLTIASPGGSFALEPVSAGTMTFYQQGGVSPGTDMPFATFYSVRADGDVFPAFNFQESLEMPPEFHLTNPTPAQTVVVTGDYSVQWTGGGNHDATWITVVINAVQDYGQVQCKVTNDGEFTIPATDLAQLPTGSGIMTVAHHDDSYFEADGGRWVRLRGGYSLDVNASTP